MHIGPDLDCVVIGYNDREFRSFAAKQREMETHSGAYHEIKTNSVRWRGQRISYMDLLNETLTKSTGRDVNFNVFEAPSLGVCYLTSFLKRRGFRVEFVNFFNRDLAKLASLLSAAPRSVAITTTFYIEDDPVIEIVDFVRRHSPQTKIIVGGPHIFNRAADLDDETLAFVFATIGADIYIIDSQGELTFSKVVDVLHRNDPSQLQSIPNLMYATGGAGFHRTGRRAEANDLDQESVNWNDFDPAVVTPLAYLRSARSCPFTCSFCQYPILAGSHDLNSIDVMARQLEELRAMGTTDLVFIDDTFNVPLPRFKKLLQMMIDRKFGFRWVSFLRCSNVDEAAIDLMKESGCIGVLLGIESGDQQILKYMNKAVKLDRYRFGIRELKKRGIATYASLICGFPGETEQSVRNSVSFIEETGPTFFNVQLYYHDARSPIHRRADEFKIEGAGYSWAHRTMDWRQAIDWSIYMYENIHNSIFFSLYGMSLWGISYLVSKGLSMQQVKAFGKASRTLLFDSLAERDADHAEQERQLLDAFRGRSDDPHADPVRAFDERFWQAQLAGSPGRVPVTRGLRPEGGLQLADIVLDRELTRALVRLAVARRTTAATVVLALFKLLLFQLSRQDDICVGMLTAGKTVPVRTRLSADMEFEELLEAVIRSTGAALDHQDYVPDVSPNVLYCYDGGGEPGRAPWSDEADIRSRPDLALRAREHQGQIALELATAKSLDDQPGRCLRSLLAYARAVAFPAPEEYRREALQVQATGA
jgi:radical SAM PhpK family P-methyltransferase